LLPKYGFNNYIQWRKKYFSENGLKDLLDENIIEDMVYPIIHLKGDDIEVAMTHSKSQYSEEYHFCKWSKHNEEHI
jgi:fructose 1,6-bisphosphatase